MCKDCEREHIPDMSCWCSPTLFMRCDEGDIIIHHKLCQPDELPDEEALKKAVAALYIDIDEE